MIRLLLIALAGLAVLLALHGIRRRKPLPPPAADEESRRLRAQLVELCRGDEVHARRLVEYQRIRTPGIDESQALRQAIERCEREGISGPR